MRRFARTELSITAIGLGAWAIGGSGYAFGWGPQDDGDSIATIHRALDLGINWIDTAAGYGLGHSERIVARALAGRGSHERPYVFTKGSLRWDAEGRFRHDVSAASLRQEVEDSLRRLAVDAIDLYQIHWPALPPARVAPPELDDGWAALVDLRREGKIRHLGVSNFSVEQMERISRIAPPETLQPPYSVLRPAIEEQILPYCQAHDIGVIVYSPMQAGLLSGAMTRDRVAALPSDDWRRGNTFFREPYLTRGLQVAEVLGRIGQRYGRSAGEVAIAWTLRQPAVSGAIVGARRPSQVDGFIGAAADLALTAEDLAAIHAASGTPEPGRA